jgi:hypothetical protein
MKIKKQHFKGGGVFHVVLETYYVKILYVKF